VQAGKFSRFKAENSAPFDRYGNALTTAAELSAGTKAADRQETQHFFGQKLMDRARHLGD